MELEGPCPVKSLILRMLRERAVRPLSVPPFPPAGFRRTDCCTSGSTFFELRWSHIPIFVVDSNRSLRPCLAGALSPKIMLRLLWGLVGASTVPPLALARQRHRPQSPGTTPARPPLARHARTPHHAPSRRARRTCRSPSLTTATTRIAFPTRAPPLPPDVYGPHARHARTVTWLRRRRDDRDRPIATAPS